MKSLFVTIAILGLALASTTASAKIAEDCERIQGTVICADPVGNSEESDGASQEVVTTSQGNEKNKAVCSGPGNSSSGC